MAVSVMRALQGMNAVAERHPVATAVTVTATKAGVADLMVQFVVEGRETVDTRRTLLFTSFGGSYQGLWQYFMYNKLYEGIWPGRGWKNTIAKIAASNIISSSSALWRAIACATASGLSQHCSSAIIPDLSLG